ncbi:MAG: hypothetical protein Q9206_004809 [Seirophora lacunosa]|nr:MAG: hypothetical protein LQ344_007779 [Seirophora lacunosa]
MVRVNLVSGLPRRMNRAAIENLVETGKIALDLLANMAGGYNADLNVPRIRWAISGLAIQTADATREPGTSGGLFRFDELRAAYTGIGVAVAGIGDLECSFFVWRVTPIMRRRFNFLGYGQLRIALLATGEGGQNK